MKKTIMVMLCSLLLAMPVLSSAERRRGPNPNVSADENANENARFKRNRALFNNKENKRIRAKRLVETEETEAKRRTEEGQDKGEGQVKVKF